MRTRSLLAFAALGISAPLLSGCLAVAATGAAVGVASTAVGVTAKTVGVAAKGTGMVVGAAIPGGGDKDDEDKRDR